MSPSVPSSRPAPWPWILGTLLLLLLACELGLHGLITFQWWDDEGYVMMTLKQYRDGLPLYDVVYSQYGPCYYVVRDWLYGGAMVTHDLTALVSSLHALLCCAVLGLTTLRLTRSTPLALLTIVMASGRVSNFLDTAGHPQEFQTLLVALVGLLAGWPCREQLRALLLGVLVGAVCMTKVNIGVFLFLPLLLFYGVELPASLFKTLLLRAVGTLIVVSPYLLMRRHLDREWGFAFATLLAAALIPLVRLFRSLSVPPNWKHGMIFLGSLATTVAALAGYQVVRGTSLLGLWNGIVGIPLRLPSAFIEPFPMRWFSAGLALLALLVFVFWLRRPPSRKWIALFSGAYGLVLCAGMFHLGPVSTTHVSRSLVTWLVPLVWLVPFAWGRLPASETPILAAGASSHDVVSAEGPSPSRGQFAGVRDDPSQAFPRRYPAFLFLVSVFLLLQAYPVAGAHVACGSIFLPVVAAVALHQSHRYWVGSSIWLQSVAWPQMALSALVAGLFAWQIWRVNQFWLLYSHNQCPNLPGMAWMRLPAPQVATLRWLTEGLQRFDTFVSLPGLNSLYFLTGKNPPSSYNVGVWMVLLDDPTQRRIVAKLAEHSRVGAVRTRSWTRWWLRGAQDRPLASQPLAQFFDTQLEPVQERNGWEILQPVRR